MNNDIVNKSIKELLPHSEPFLFVDKILSIEDNNITTEKKFKDTEDYFKGHFPGFPLVPGVLLIESMAQTAGILASQSEYKEVKKKVMFYLAKVIDIRFRQSVFPNDTVFITASILQKFNDLVKFKVFVKLDSKIVTEGELVLKKVDK